MDMYGGKEHGQKNLRLLSRVAPFGQTKMIVDWTDTVHGMVAEVVGF